jgi:hypothetical protein
MSEREVVFVNGDELSFTLPADLPLGNAKRFVLAETNATSAMCPASKWELRDPQGFLLNENTLVGDLVDRDKVARVFLTLPVGAGGS